MRGSRNNIFQVAGWLGLAAILMSLQIHAVAINALENSDCSGCDEIEIQENTISQINSQMSEMDCCNSSQCRAACPQCFVSFVLTQKQSFKHSLRAQEALVSKFLFILEEHPLLLLRPPSLVA